MLSNEFRFSHPCTFLQRRCSAPIGNRRGRTDAEGVTAMSLEQIDALLTAAYAAINVGELSFAVPNGRTVTFHSLDALTRYIDWLERKRREAVDQAAAAASNSGYAPKVRFQEVSE